VGEQKVDLGISAVINSLVNGPTAAPFSSKRHFCRLTYEASPSDPSPMWTLKQSAGHEGMLTQTLLMGYTDQTWSRCA
jgi:hypothetical protein